MIRKSKIIGILNITEDSFSDGGKYINNTDALKRVDQMILQGCDVIDIGAESTKPGFEEVDSSKQLDRILPIIKYIKLNHKKSMISIDTRSSLVAEKAIELGVDIINDVSSGMHDRNMFDLVSRTNTQIILTHMPLEHLSKDTINSDDIIRHIETYFRSRINQALKNGIDIKNIIIDPGICFGKSGKDNIKIINKIDLLVKNFNRVCIGASNKRFSKHLFSEIADDDLKIASLVISSIASYHNVEFIRVHDIEPNHDAKEVSWKSVNS